MKHLLKTIEDQIVSSHNNLRFRCGSMIDAAVASADTKIEKIIFLKEIFGYSLVTLNEIVDRMSKGESFLDITNQMNIEKRLV